MGAYLETGIILKISSKMPLEEAMKKGYFGDEFEDLAVELYEEFHDEEKKIYEYYPKYMNLEELRDTKLKFNEDYLSDEKTRKEEENNIEEFFRNVKANSSKELFDAIEKFNKRGMTIDNDGIYIGFKVYRLRLSLDGKIFLECYGDFLAFLEKMIKERYPNGYSPYIKASIS